MEHDKVVSEARARIMWGDPALSVRDFLIANGVSDTVADAKIKEFLLERNKEVKSIGVRNTLTGLVLAGAAGSVLCWISAWILPPGSAGVYGLGGRGIIAGVIALVAIVLYGVWKVVKGIICIVRPQAEHKSISE
jgi:hypothetical protein